MDNYKVKLYARAYRDLDSIYQYITFILKAPMAAKNLIVEIETAILSLELFPERGAIRKIGRFSNKDYRQLFVKNYTIIYKINMDKKEIYIVTVQYSSRNF